jgi:hypothetical protein
MVHSFPVGSAVLHLTMSFPFRVVLYLSLIKVMQKQPSNKLLALPPENLLVKIILIPHFILLVETVALNNQRIYQLTITARFFNYPRNYFGSLVIPAVGVHFRLKWKSPN